MVLLSIDFANLHTILETLYGEMMPLCEEMMDVGKGLPDWERSSMSPSACGSRWRAPSR